MKIIDLLNKIANGEELPKKIKYDDIVFELRYGTYQSKNTFFQEFLEFDLSNLNDKVKIIDYINKEEKNESKRNV